MLNRVFVIDPDGVLRTAYRRPDGRVAMYVVKEDTPESESIEYIIEEIRRINEWIHHS